MAKKKKRPNFENPDDLQVITALHCAKVLAIFKGNKQQTRLRLGVTYHTLQRYLELAHEIEQYRTDFRRVLNTMGEP